MEDVIIDFNKDDSGTGPSTSLLVYAEHMDGRYAT